MCLETNGFITNDGQMFHTIAVEQAKKIRSDGWSKFSIAPENQIIAGLVSVIYALFAINKIVYIFFAVLLNVICLVFIWFFLSLNNVRLGKNFGFLAFLFYPSILEWTVSIHRDGIFILGNYIFLYASFLVSRARELKGLLFSLLWFFLAFLFIEISRSYWNLWIWLFTCALLAKAALYFLKAKILVTKKITAISAIFFFLSSYPLCFKSSLKFVFYKTFTIENVNRTESSNSPSGSQSGTLARSDSSGLLYYHLEKLFSSVIISRRDIINDGGISLDPHSSEELSGSNFVFELFRSLQRGLFSPLPDLWFQEGKSGFYALGKKIFIFISPLSWFCLAGVACGLFTKTWHKNLLFVFSFCVISIWFISFVVPNVGTMMRLRYGFYGFLLAAGASYWLHLLLKMTPYAKADS